MSNHIVVYNNGSTEDLRYRYFTSIQGWQMMRGCVIGDLTPKQLDRFHAWEAAGHHVDLACWLIGERQRRQDRTARVGG